MIGNVCRRVGTVSVRGTRQRIRAQSCRPLTPPSVRVEHGHEEESNDSEAELPMAAHTVDVTPLAEKMRNEVRSYTRKHSDVRLVGILADEGHVRQDAETYSERIAETLFEDGIEYELVRSQGKERSDVEATIRQMNARADVHGILVFYPICKGLQANLPRTYLNKMNGTYYKTNDDYLRDIVQPSKDVEGLCHDYNARWIFRARGRNRMSNEVYVPCTAMAVMKILEAYHHQPMDVTLDPIQRWSQTTITVVNRSEILGRPLAAMLALNGARVYSVDEDSILLFQQGGHMKRCIGLTLEDCLELSSIVVTGVPSPDFRLPSELIQDWTTVVNVSEFSNIDEGAFADRPSVAVIPQVGKVTVAALEHNLIRLHETATSFSVTDF
jgi:methylenetetrahydrofolate dehydrogenase (NAD+)